jgi:hypothetical protein
MSTPCSRPEAHHTLAFGHLSPQVAIQYCIVPHAEGAGFYPLQLYPACSASSVMSKPHTSRLCARSMPRAFLLEHNQAPAGLRIAFHAPNRPAETSSPRAPLYGARHPIIHVVDRIIPLVADIRHAAPS